MPQFITLQKHIKTYIYDKIKYFNKYNQLINNRSICFYVKLGFAIKKNEHYIYKKNKYFSFYLLQFLKEVLI